MGRTVSMAQFEQKVHQGPLPDPETLRGYEDIVPGAAERIISLMEQQSMHRMSIERSVLEGDSRRADRGQWMGFSLALVGIILGAYLISLGFIFTGSAIVTVPLVSLVAIFVRTVSVRKQERTEKAKIMAGQSPNQIKKR
jgi:uncharacterized membrane protein